MEKNLLMNLKKTNIGNPDNFYEISGEKYNFNDLFIIQFLFKIKKFLNKEPKSILEIGGGYGALVNKLKKLYSNSTIYLLDLPEAGLLQTYYLSSIYKEKNFFYTMILKKKKMR